MLLSTSSVYLNMHAPRKKSVTATSKPQDHISPSGKPWHSRSIMSWFPCPIQCLSVLATSLSFEYMDRRPNANLARQIPHSQGVFRSYPSWMDVTCTPELLGFEYMKPRLASKHLIFWDGKLAEPQDIFLYVFCCDVRSDLYSSSLSLVRKWLCDAHSDGCHKGSSL
ncbi:hypothetical protein IW261DRAFT_727455 [Armillaria novae-zelandiae]|uniref:Uncharacterized protein n=1 Tax=Armillaria novae-zelandiae TaxID=153914 RepID=A0AA39NW02_9AGAR|nr:hypothetical protein IW261DRAFT_727455 [Armillaria novae-zelandiae]